MSKFEKALREMSRAERNRAMNRMFAIMFMLRVEDAVREAALHPRPSRVRLELARK